MKDKGIGFLFPPEARNISLQSV